MKKKLRIALTVLGSVIVIACVVMIVLIFTKPELFVKERTQQTSHVESNVKLSTETVESGQIQESQKMTYFTGYDSLFITKSGYIPLTNESKNGEDNIYMLYTIYTEDGSEIYTSDLIAPGMELQWRAGTYLEVGNYTLTFHTQPYKVIDMEKELEMSNMKPLYYINQTVSLTIVE